MEIYILYYCVTVVISISNITLKIIFDHLPEPRYVNRISIWGSKNENFQDKNIENHYQYRQKCCKIRKHPSDDKIWLDSYSILMVTHLR